ncbi:MAG: HNH endonuclease signature motif containing protein [Cyanobacteria bacterium J06639_1]
MYVCPRCGDTLLFQPEQCPTCAAREQKQRKASRARERRASYDPSGKVTDKEFWQLLKWYPVCPCCGKSWSDCAGAIARDHILPLSQGGPNSMTNMQPLCESCNLWKSDRAIAFTPTTPGRPVALPRALYETFASLPQYQEEDADTQLGVLAAPVEPAFPDATPQELECETVRLTWEAIAASKTSAAS